MLKLIPTTLEHLLILQKTIRPMDAEEVIMLTGGIPLERLTISYFVDAQTIIDTTDDIILAVGGINSETNVIWLLTTTAIETRKIKFLRYSKVKLKELLQKHKFLQNIGYQKNTQHIQWLEWLNAIITHQDNKLFYFKLLPQEDD